MTLSIRSAIFLLALAAALPVQAGESVYTSINLDGCKAVSEGVEGEPDGDSVTTWCAGYKDYRILFKEGDLRQAVYYGHLDQRIIDEAFQTFGHFNNMSGKVEWRIDASGKPHATIMRFFVVGLNPETGEEDKAREGQVLVVSRVGQPDDKMGCVIGFVDAKANKNANELARKLADDRATGFDCKTEKPDFAGSVTPDIAQQPMYQFPDYAQ